MRAILLASILFSLLANAQEPLYQQTVVDTGDLRPGDVVVPIGMSNWNQISEQVNFPSIQWVNAAAGGLTVSEWATGKQTSRNGKKLWSAVPSNASIIWVNPVNRANTDLDTYVSATTNDTYQVLDYIAANYNVREVWLTGLHGEPFAPLSSKQPNAYAYASGVIAEDVSNNASYPFKVIHAAYIYAETTPRGDGLFWSLSDFGGDKLHLSSSGNKKAAGLLEEYMTNAIGGSPDPDPDPEVCPIPKWATECRLRNGQCKCR